MPATTQITAQTTDDPDTKMYHTRFEMCSKTEQCIRGSSEEIGSEFAKLVLEIRGVSRIVVAPYMLLVTKANLFSWEEIELPVRELLLEFAKSQQIFSNPLIENTREVKSSDSV